MYPDPMPRLVVALQAFEAARKRFEANAQDADSSFIPLTETLWWAICINDGLRSHGAEEYEAALENFDHGRIVRGFVYVRNMLGHARATVVHRSGGGRVYPLTFPMVYPPQELYWLPADELPQPDNPQPRNRQAYEESVAGQSVVRTLSLASSWLHYSVGILGLRLEDTGQPGSMS
jgi:hypothetical protein